jgi:hypothetical protein
MALRARRKHVTLLLAAAGLAIPAWAQDTRVIPLAAYQREGRFVVGLKPEQILIKGVNAGVRTVELERVPRRIVLLVDASRSMGGDGRGDNSWPYAMQLARDFLDLLQPRDQVALHTFAEKHLRLSDFTDDSTLLRRTLEQIAAPNSRAAGRSRGTDTNLGLALIEIIATYGETWKVGDTILLISDGEYKGDQEVRLAKAEPELLTRGVRLMLLRIGPLVRQIRELVTEGRRGDENTKREAGYFASQEMSDLAKRTGGFTLAPWDHAQLMSSGELIPLAPEVLKKSVQVAYAFARNVYRVELSLSEALTKQENRIANHGRQWSRREGPDYLLPATTLAIAAELRPASYRTHTRTCVHQ